MSIGKQIRRYRTAMGLTMEQVADESRTYPARPVPLNEAARTYAAEEPTMPYGWPFKNIKPSQWQLLGDEEMEQIEGLIASLIRARPQAKHREPAFRKAAA